MADDKKKPSVWDQLPQEFIDETLAEIERFENSPDWHGLRPLGEFKADIRTLVDSFPKPVAGECKRGYNARCQRIVDEWQASRHKSA